jgi:DNA-binding CsgD family transcriptional regulator
MADSILRSRDGLVLDANELRASNVCSTGELRAAISAATSTTRSGNACETRTAALLPRPSGRRSLFVLAAPLPRNGVPIGSQVAAAAVFVTDPERPPATQVEAIRSMFRLTPSEARLVQCLVEGLSLEDAADRLSIQVETARKRVKSVFQKTDTHRQAELISLVLMSTLPGTA